MTPQKAILARNMKVTIGDVIVQYQQAQKVQTRARTGHYKVAILLMASVVEALLYDIIDTKCAANPALWKTIQYKRYTKLHTIVGTKIGVSKDLYICREDIVDFQLGKKAMLEQMNIFCRDAKIISLKQSLEIEYVMRKRNEIHLQGLASVNRTYTAAMLDRVAKIARELFDIV
jgi:hypothetical protein